jgi:hypothetical protein
MLLIKGKQGFHDYTNYNNIYWTIEVYELKIHCCMFYSQIAHENESMLFRLNSYLLSLKWTCQPVTLTGKQKVLKEW